MIFVSSAFSAHPGCSNRGPVRRLRASAGFWRVYGFPEEVPSGGTVNKFSPRLMNYPSLIDQYLIGVAHEVMQ